MTHFDVFNGDADGICALHQLRMAEPVEAIRVSASKREIGLLQRVTARAGDSVTVLDLCADANRTAIEALLAAGVRIDYIDHHACATLPAHPLLRAQIHPDPDICTAMLVDQALGGRFRAWAVVGAYGDNLDRSARRLARSMGMSTAERLALRRLGRLLNYNAYGESTHDLNIEPVALYLIMHRHREPRDACSEAAVQTIARTMQDDLRLAWAVSPYALMPGASVTLLPDARWSRRVSGTLANDLARREPALAHAVLTPTGQCSFTVSVRAPHATMRGADALCKQFAHGGGRPAAAGIDHLPEDALDAFIRALGHAFPAATLPSK